MRSVAVAAVLLGAGLVAGHALADTVPVPVPTVPVPVPTVSVPVSTVPVPVPKVTVPAPPAAAPAPVKVPASPKVLAPAVPAPTAGGSSSSSAPSTPSGPTVGSSARTVTSSVDKAASTVGSILGSSSGPSASSSSSAPSAGSSGSSSRSGPERLQIESLRSSRTWISTSGPKRRRGTTLTFVLPRDARVVLVVKQVSPRCRIAGHFSVQGHAGLNRVRFPGRAKDLQLGAGTYRISARTRAGRLLRRVTIVVVEGGAPTSTELSSARAANVCTSVSSLASAGAAAGPTGASNTSLFVGHASASGAPAQGTNTHSGAATGVATGRVLGSTVAKAARAIQPLIVALLALAILLLGLASLPGMALPESRTSDLL